MRTIKLGLFGAGIARSQAPRLHEIAGRLCGLEVRYDLFDLSHSGTETFETELARRAEAGFRGVNVTHPVKEQAAKLVTIPDEAMRKVGALNTVRFTDQTGYNTDYSGFIKAFRKQFGDARPGKVLMVGAGGVGKAVAFALAHLEPKTTIYLVDTDLAKAQALAANLHTANVSCHPHSVTDLVDLAEVDGLVNCTPLGMQQYPGTAIPKALIGGQSWAFDAVYTPLETPFLKEAQAKDLEILTGYELFLYQGIDAFELFTGQRVDEARLRRALAS